MEAANTRAFLSQCESLKRQVEIVIKDLNTLDTNYLNSGSNFEHSRINEEIADSKEQALALLKPYGNIRNSGAKVGIVLPEIVGGENSRAFLRELIVALDAGIGFVGRGTSTSPEEKDRLASLKNQVRPIENWNLGLFKHLSKAIEEQEMAHYLPAAMVAAKVTMYIHERLAGANETEKANKLVEEGLLPAKLEPNFLTGVRLARHYYLHETLEVPEPQESMNIVSFAVDFALRYQKSKMA